MSEAIRIEPTAIPDCVIARIAVYDDGRGSFRELFRTDLFAAAGLPATVAQINHSRSARGVVRGLHFQWKPPMAKLMRVARGAAFLVAVDIRRGSPSCGRAVWRTMTAGDDLWLAAPAGFARGLQALEDDTEIEYLCTATYSPDHEAGIRWDDPALEIPWPIRDAVLSAKDRAAPTLRDWLAGPTGGVFSFAI